MQTLSFEITGETSGLTVREFLSGKLHFSKRQISSLKYREDGIRVNGEMSRVSRVLHDGDVLKIVPKTAGSLYLDHGTFTDPPEILYEDGDLLIVNKPSGMVCHPSPGHYADSLANQVAAYAARKNETWTIRLVGRLDKDTSGIVIFAKSSEAAALLSKGSRLPKAAKPSKTAAHASFPPVSGGPTNRIPESSSQASDEIINRIPEFSSQASDEIINRIPKSFPPVLNEKEPAISKIYYAIVEGHPGSGFVDLPIGHDPDVLGKMKTDPLGKPAVTHYEEIRSLGENSLLKVRIENGRTHQIRVHLSAIGHPLLGDSMYGHGTKNETRAMLHCAVAAFTHPFTHETMTVTAPFPKDWRGNCESLRNHEWIIESAQSRNNCEEFRNCLEGLDRVVFIEISSPLC